MTVPEEFAFRHERGKLSCLCTKATGTWAMKPDGAELIHFGPYCLDRLNARLLRDGQDVPLTPKAMDLLAHLATRPDRLVTKDELLSSVWPDVIVSDASVKVCVGELRKALGDDPRSPRYI